MARAEAVGSLPLHQGNILRIHRHVKPSAGRERVLVLAVALEIERTAVDQEFSAFRLHGADTVRKGVDILTEGHSHLI